MAKSTALTKIMMVAVGRWQMLEQLEASLEQLNARQQLTNLVHAVLQVGDSIFVSILCHIRFFIVNVQKCHEWFKQNCLYYNYHYACV